MNPRTQSRSASIGERHNGNIEPKKRQNKRSLKGADRKGLVCPARQTATDIYAEKFHSRKSLQNLQ